MSTDYTGGCACGALRYRISGEPRASLDCQCLDCQKESGTGHASHLVFDREKAEVTGPMSHFEMVADSGNHKTRGFCPTCGSPVIMTFAASPGSIGVRAASLDDPSRYRPQFVVYAARGHAWDRLDPALPKFDFMPPR